MTNPTIRIVGDNFALTYTSTTSKTERELLIPLSQPAILVRTLRSRQSAADLRIGNEASPTQHMVEAWLQSNEARIDVREAAAKREALEEKYSINLDEIEI